MAVENTFDTDKDGGVKGKSPTQQKPGKTDSDPSKGGSSERGKQG